MSFVFFIFLKVALGNDLFLFLRPKNVGDCLPTLSDIGTRLLLRLFVPVDSESYLLFSFACKHALEFTRIDLQAEAVSILMQYEENAPFVLEHVMSTAPWAHLNESANYLTIEQMEKVLFPSSNLFFEGKEVTSIC